MVCKNIDLYSSVLIHKYIKTLLSVFEILDALRNGNFQVA